MSSQLASSALEHVGAGETLNAVPYGAYVSDDKGRILFWSDAAARITGWQADEVLGRSCADSILMHVDMGGHCLCGGPACPLHRALSTGERTRQPLLVFAQHRQGHRVPVEVSVAPLCDDSGRRVGVVEVFRDLTRTVQDLRRAKIIQDYILHYELPTDDRVHFQVRFRPEEIVGGDFHRVQALGEDRYAVMVADAMGHGLISAFYTVHLRSAWDECQSELCSPAVFLHHVNQRLHALAGPEGYFATAVFLVLDLGSGRVRYVVAGHPAPLVLRSAGEIEVLSGHSPALGLVDSATYKESEVQLSPGDHLLICTDGAIELANQHGEMLGMEGFIRMLPSAPNSILELAALENKLVGFIRPASLPDDLTLLSIQFLRRRRAAQRSDETKWKGHAAA